MRGPARTNVAATGPLNARGALFVLGSATLHAAAMAALLWATRPRALPPTQPEISVALVSDGEGAGSEASGAVAPPADTPPPPVAQIAPPTPGPSDSTEDAAPPEPTRAAAPAAPRVDPSPAPAPPAVAEIAPVATPAQPPDVGPTPSTPPAPRLAEADLPPPPTPMAMPPALAPSRAPPLPDRPARTQQAERERSPPSPRPAARPSPTEPAPTGRSAGASQADAGLGLGRIEGGPPSATPAGPTQGATLLDPGCPGRSIAYPPLLERSGVAGTVRLRLRVSDDGRVVEAAVEESSGNPALDEAAREGYRRCRFLAALRDGVPVWNTTRALVTFRLPQAGRW